MNRSETNPSRRAFLSNTGMGFAGLALGAMLHKDGFGSQTAWSPPNGLPALSAKSQERDLAVHERRRQPHGNLRSQADAHEVRRQDDC